MQISKLRTQGFFADRLSFCQQASNGELVENRRRDDGLALTHP